MYQSNSQVTYVLLGGKPIEIDNAWIYDSKGHFSGFWLKIRKVMIQLYRLRNWKWKQNGRQDGIKTHLSVISWQEFEMKMIFFFNFLCRNMETNNTWIEIRRSGKTRFFHFLIQWIWEPTNINNINNIKIQTLISKIYKTWNITLTRNVHYALHYNMVCDDSTWTLLKLNKRHAQTQKNGKCSIWVNI